MILNDCNILQLFFLSVGLGVVWCHSEQGGPVRYWCCLEAGLSWKMWTFGTLEELNSVVSEHGEHTKQYVKNNQDIPGLPYSCEQMESLWKDYDVKFPAWLVDSFFASWSSWQVKPSKLMQVRGFSLSTRSKALLNTLLTLELQQPCHKSYTGSTDFHDTCLCLDCKLGASAVFVHEQLQKIGWTFATWSCSMHCAQHELLGSSCTVRVAHRHIK